MNHTYPKRAWKQDCVLILMVTESMDDEIYRELDNLMAEADISAVRAVSTVLDEDTFGGFSVVKHR